MSRAKAMGTWVETRAAGWLQGNGFPEAERLALRGANDQGDIRLRRSPLVIAECKRGKKGIKLGPWMNELAVEMGNSGADLGLLISDQAGVGDRRVGHWFSAMHYSKFIMLLEMTPDYRAPRMRNLSPVKLNSVYVPMLEDSSPDLGLDIPLALTHSPGRPEAAFVCGPLWQIAQRISMVEDDTQIPSEVFIPTP